MKLVPVEIRPHLVSFLFKELEGKEASYMDTKSKSIKIYPFSSLGRVLCGQLVQSEKLGRWDHYILFLTIERSKSFEYVGQLCVEVNKMYEKLMLPLENAQNINNLLEDIFRISFMYYVQGCLEHDSKASVVKAINRFIEKYDLLEAGFSTETLRRLYYREKAKNKKLSRMQNQFSTQVTGYKTMSQ